jgi:hypothetical protein
MIGVRGRGVVATGFIAFAACRSAPMALHGTFEYPKPDHERCGAPKGEETLDVLVEDEAGAGFPGAAVYVAPLAEGPAAPVPPVTSVYTDKSGRATIRLSAGGAFAVTGALTGFAASVRTVTVSDGCTADITLVLRLPDASQH